MGRRYHYRSRRRNYKRRSRSFSSSNWYPVLKLIGAVLGILTACAVLTLGVMVLLEAVFHVDTPLKPDGIIASITKVFTDDDILVVSPTPYYTPEPTATPHPMDEFDPKESEKEIVFSAESPFKWFSDPCVYDDVMMFVAGRTVDGDLKMDTIMRFDPQTGDMAELPIHPDNDHFVYIRFNSEWLVYLDADVSGGGNICAYSLTEADAEPILIKKVYVGQPELTLYDHYIAWMERTGTSRDKLYVCDILTNESTAVAMFSNSGYGTSAPYLHDGTLIWAAEDSTYHEDGRTTSTIRRINLDESGISDILTGTYVHDPETNGEYFAWIDAHHSLNSNLYIAAVSDGQTLEPILVDEQVIDFHIDEEFVAYSIDEAAYVYVFATGESYRISPEDEKVQLLGASGGYVIWMDVTTRNLDVMKFSYIPI